MNRINYYKQLSIIVFLIAPTLSIGQGKFKTYDKRNIHINFRDSIVKAQINNQKDEVTLDNNKTYYWYFSGKIHSNTGGYRGNLLDGEYTVFTQGKDLLVSGHFMKGLKNGVWKRWHSNGKLKSIAHWENGLKSGALKFYKKNGQLKKKLNYKKDRLHGKCIFIEGGEKEERRYKKGREVTPFKENIKQIFRSDSTQNEEENPSEDE